MVITTTEFDKQMKNIFKPDLIVEVTSVCNRACNGCYAPNVVSKDSAQELMKKDSNLFLDVDKLQALIDGWDTFSPDVISVRGGEPSLHPELLAIVRMLSTLGQNVVVETHARWLLGNERNQYISFIEGLRNTKGIIKISFDSMHGLKSIDLKEITEFLDDYGISYIIGITEKTYEEFFIKRLACNWIEDSKIYFQKKAENINELIKPMIGVINVQGELRKNLTTKFDIRDLIKEAVTC